MVADAAGRRPRAHGELGIGAVRVTLRWTPGETSPRGSTVVALRRAQETALGRRLVLAVYSKARRAPLIARRRHEYCWLRRQPARACAAT